MNENPEGTPNPLNPVQGAAPTGPAPEGETKVEDAAEVEQPLPAEQPLPEEQPLVEETVVETEAVAAQPMPEPVEVGPISEPAVEEAATETTEVVTEQHAEANPAVEEAAVALETMEAVADQGVAKAPEAPVTTPEAPTEEPKGSIVEPKKKSKKTGLILAIIFLIIAIVAGAAAAIILLNPFARADAVPAAIAKLLSGDSTQIVAMDGIITVSANGNDAQFTNLAVDFNSSVNSQNGEGFVGASVKADLVSGDSFGFKLDEINTKDGDLYIKISDVYKELLEYYDVNDPTNLLQDCAAEDGNCLDATTIIDVGCDDESEGCTITDTTVTQESLSGESLLNYIDVFDVINDEWIKIPSGDFNSINGLVNVDATAQCLVDAAGTLGKYGKDFAATYKKYQFIEYSTDNLAITRKKNPLYRLTINADKFADFINSMNNSGFANELMACVGGPATNTDISSSALKEIVKYLPMIYVEINDNNEFTRVYLSLATPDGAMSVTADLALSYPASITVNEPSVYLDLNQAMNMILTSFFQQPITSLEMGEIISE